MTRSNSGVSQPSSVRSDALDRLFDHGKSVGGLPGAAQCLCHLERDESEESENLPSRCSSKPARTSRNPVTMSPRLMASAP